MTHRIAVITFPGTNCEAEMLRAVERSGMVSEYVRWNDDLNNLESFDGYVLPGGFSYEDRGRAGMVAAREGVMEVVREQAGKGKPVLGICNGAQILVESGLIPNGSELSMCLARNTLEGEAVGFLSKWDYVRAGCREGRCLGSAIQDPMHIPMAHNEGRWTTRDRDLLSELRSNDQVAFIYCNEGGTPIDAPNGALESIAGVCNREGNVVALMPHPERTSNGQIFFDAMKRWMDTSCHTEAARSMTREIAEVDLELHKREPRYTEIFIDTIITNNEERTVEQAARKNQKQIKLKQYRYLRLEKRVKKVLSNLALFNPNKETALIRREGKWYSWDADAKEVVSAEPPSSKILLLRRDEPDTGAAALGENTQTGICYGISSIEKDEIDSDLLTVLHNPHASTLEELVDG